MKIILNPLGHEKFREQASRHSLQSTLSKPYITRSIFPSGALRFTYDPEKIKRFYVDRDIHLTVEKLEKDFETTLFALERACGRSNLFREYDPRFVAQMVEDAEKLRSESKCVVIRDNLALEASVGVEPLVRAWNLRRFGSNCMGVLVHPLLVEADIQRLQSAGFRVLASETALENLSQTVRSEENKQTKATISRTAAGIRIGFRSGQKRLEEVLLKLGTICYNIRPGQNEHLQFVKKTSPGVFEFDEFLMPSVCQILRSHGVCEIEGLEDVAPQFQPFDFDCSLRTDHLPFYEIQDDALDAWHKAGRVGTVVLPTGSGKSTVGVRAIVEICRPTLIVVPSLELQEHWRSEILKWTNIPEDQIGTYSAEKKEIRPITIITYHSGYRLVQEEDSGVEENESFLETLNSIRSLFALLILDEGHHSPAKIFRKIMINLRSPYRLSLTATSQREDGNEVLSYLACGPVIFESDYVSLARAGQVCPMVYEKIVTHLNAAETELIYEIAKLRGDFLAETVKLKTRGDPVAMAELDARKASSRQRIKELTRQITWNSIDPEPSYRIAKRKVFGFAESKMAALVNLVRKHEGSRIIIFNQFRKGTVLIQAALARAGLECAVITGGPNSRGGRREVFGDFSSGQMSRLASTSVLDEGVNVPACDVVIVVNGNSTKLQMIQRAGRCARPAPLKIGYVYELVASCDHRLYRPEYSDCQKFSDFSMYELTISAQRDISPVLASDTMKMLVQNVLIKRSRERIAS